MCLLDEGLHLLRFKDTTPLHINYTMGTLASSKKIHNPMLSIDTLILKEYLERGIIESVEWIRGDQQLADPLTKIGVCTDKLKNELSRD